MSLLIACLFSEILRGRRGWVGTRAWATGTQGEERGCKIKELPFYFCVKVGKHWQIETEQHMFLSYFSKPLTVWLVFKYRWMLSPLIKPYQNGQQQMGNVGRGKSVSSFIRTAHGSTTSWLRPLIAMEWIGRLNKNTSEEWESPLSQKTWVSLWADRVCVMGDCVDDDRRTDKGLKR